MTQPFPEDGATHTEAPFRVTRRMVAESIGWMDAFGSDDRISFNYVDWHGVDEDGEVELEGRIGDYNVSVAVQITEIVWDYEPDPCPTCGNIVGCENGCEYADGEPS